MQLINGGLASKQNLLYWTAVNTSVQSDSDMLFYSIGSGGYIKQTVFTHVDTDIVLSAMVNPTNDNMLVKLNVYFSDGNIEFSNHIPTNNKRWAKFNYTTTVSDSPINKVELIVSNTSNEPCGINIISCEYSAEVDNEHIQDSKDFISKAFLYGLDANKPTLGGDDSAN